MPKITLTDPIIRSLGPEDGRPQTEFYDAGFQITGVSLYLVVGRRKKTWYVKALGRSRFRNLGHWASPRAQREGQHGISLAEARAQAAIVAGELAAGKNPRPQKRRRRTAHAGKTVATLKDLWVDHLRRPEQTDSPVPRHRNWRYYEADFRTQALPVWGKKMPQEIEAEDVRELILGLCTRGAFRRADTVRLAVKSFFDWCVLAGVLTTNPAKEVEPLGYRLGPAKGKSWRALEWDELIAVWKACEQVPGKVTRWLRLLLLLGTRPLGLLGAMWKEIEIIDDEPTWWTLPGARLAEVDGRVAFVGGNKNKADHYLWVGTPTARSLLQECSGESDVWVFPGKKTHIKPTSGRYIIEEIRRISGVKDFVPRLGKSTFCTRCLEAGSVAKTDIALVANHRIPGVPVVTQEHYIDRNDADLARIRRTLEIWERELHFRLDGRRADVVPFPQSGTSG